MITYLEKISKTVNHLTQLLPVVDILYSCIITSKLETDIGPLFLDYRLHLVFTIKSTLHLSLFVYVYSKPLPQSRYRTDSHHHKIILSYYFFVHIHSTPNSSPAWLHHFVFPPGTYRDPISLCSLQNLIFITIFALFKRFFKIGAY